jgi:hypothetical protein
MSRARALRSTSATPPRREVRRSNWWFDADNVHWLLENFETFVTTYRHPGIERVERGGDCFTISGGGSDLEPVYFLQNRRSKQVDNAGNYSLPLGEEPAYELIEELTELRREITT